MDARRRGARLTAQEQEQEQGFGLADGAHRVGLVFREQPDEPVVDRLQLPGGAHLQVGDRLDLDEASLDDGGTSHWTTWSIGRMRSWVDCRADHSAGR